MTGLPCTKPVEPAPFLPDYLQFLLATASGLASHPFHLQATKAGVPVAEWRVMACLWDSDGQTISVLARLAQMEQSRLTRVIERMEKRGYVFRVRQQGDRRKVRVWLEPEGRRIAGELVWKARQQEAGFLRDHLTPAEARRLKSLLSKLIDSAGKGGPPSILRN